MKYVIGIGAVIIVIALVFMVGKFVLGGGNGFGNGGSGGDNNGESGAAVSDTVVSSTVEVSDASETENDLIIITLDGNEIFYNGEKVESAEALKEKIVDDFSEENTYQVNYKEALKVTYDDVKQVLDEISEGSFAIKIVYNEDA